MPKIGVQSLEGTSWVVCSGESGDSKKQVLSLSFRLRVFSKCLCLYNCLFVGKVMSPHHSDTMLINLTRTDTQILAQVWLFGSRIGRKSSKLGF